MTSGGFLASVKFVIIQPAGKESRGRKKLEVNLDEIDPRSSLGESCSGELPGSLLSPVQHQGQTELPKPDLMVRVPNHHG